MFTPLFKNVSYLSTSPYQAKFTVYETMALKAEAIKIMDPRAPGQGESWHCSLPFVTLLDQKAGGISHQEDMIIT